MSVNSILESSDPEDDVGLMCEALGITHQDLINEINFRNKVKFENAMKVQFRAAKVQGERRTIRAGAVGGEVTQQIHPVLYQNLRRRFGAEALNDPGFIRDLLKSHPELKVKSRSERLTIVKPEFAGNSAPNNRQGVRGKRGRWAA